MKTWLIIAILICFLGCKKDEPVAVESHARFEIITKTTGMTSYGRPYIRITVKNAGDRAGYNASCYAKAKNAAGTIIDTGFAYFADGATIGIGETAQDDAIFFDLTSHGQYVSVAYELDWLDR